ncbi:MAG: RHS repeat-associated core domain-containing protein [Candidatus Saccharicenans sp.]|nr:RHS repeat-associated core domain-containing protein [Candidatus Saccharicenans sp.]
MVAEYQPATGRYFYYTTDQINSTRVVADDNGNVVYASVHDPYGGIHHTWANAFNPELKFSGKEQDAESGLYYFGARYYDPTLYRFLSPDPVIPTGPALYNPQRWNLYGYCGGNPVRNIEIDGKSYIVFSRWQQAIYIYTSDNILLGVFPASNNVVKGHSYFPYGEWEYSHYNYDKYKNNKDNDSIGPQGIVVFNIGNGYEGYGIHAGRNNWQHPTLGCIRTTSEAMWVIWFLHFKYGGKGDPIKKITVTDEHIIVEGESGEKNQVEKEKFWKEYSDYVYAITSFMLFITDPFFTYGAAYIR